LSESASSDAHSEESNRSDISFDMCLARWAFWIIDSWDTDGEVEVDFKRNVMVTLLNALGPTGIARDRNVITALLQAICAGDAALEEATKTLLPSSSTQPSHNWDVNDMAEMDERLTTLLSFKLNELESPVEVQDPSLQQPRILESVSQVELMHGWRLLDERTNWRPSPIGVYAGCSVSL